MAFVIPPRPASYSPTGKPPGSQFDVKLVSFHDDRPHLPTKPRLLIIHTNAACGEGNLDQASRWAEERPNKNTCPTWSVERSGRARRMVSSDRRAIANATVDSIQVQDGQPDVATFSLAIETADLGWCQGDPGEANVFSDGQLDSIPLIVAYEAWGNRFPIVTPSVWYGSGVAGHTDPFPYPYYTLDNGKTCPGREKKHQVRNVIMPRAKRVLDDWLGEVPEALWDPANHRYWLFPLDGGKPTLRVGAQDTGSIGHVRYAEHALNAAAFLHSDGEMTVGEPDGVFDSRMQHALIQLQANQGLAVSGVVEATTWRALDAHIKLAQAT